MSFSINDILNTQSKETAYFTIKNIPINKIRPSENNLYGIRDIDELAANIEAIGLQHNLVVKAEKPEGDYEIISGERRWRACMQLFENGNTNFEYLPCKIENESSNKMNELKLIYANSMARELTNYEKMEQARRIRELLYALKSEGHEFTGRMSAIVAGILEVSPAQVKRLEKINKDLSDGLKDEFKSGNIGVTAAYELSTLKESEQGDALQELRANGAVDVKAHRKKQELNIQTLYNCEIIYECDTIKNTECKKNSCGDFCNNTLNINFAKTDETQKPIIRAIKYNGQLYQRWEVNN